MLVTPLAVMEKMGARTDPLTDQPELATTMWAKLTAAAEQFNEPGRFTAFLGYDWGPEGPPAADED